VPPYGKLHFFPSPGELRRWLEKNHDRARELWVGFYRKESGRPSITWPESVDEALCFGWIDGVRKTVDDVRYTIRFTPRNPDSFWSAGAAAKRSSPPPGEGSDLVDDRGLQRSCLTQEAGWNIP
jgi:hypothetical protein